MLSSTKIMKKSQKRKRSLSTPRSNSEIQNYQNYLDQSYQVGDVTESLFHQKSEKERKLLKMIKISLEEFQSQLKVGEKDIIKIESLESFNEFKN